MIETENVAALSTWRSDHPLTVEHLLGCGSTCLRIHIARLDAAALAQKWEFAPTVVGQLDGSRLELVRSVVDQTPHDDLLTIDVREAEDVLYQVVAACDLHIDHPSELLDALDAVGAERLQQWCPALHWQE